MKCLRTVGRVAAEASFFLGGMWVIFFTADRLLLLFQRIGFPASAFLLCVGLLLGAFACDRREEVRRMRALDKKIEQLTQKAYDTFLQKKLTDGELLRLEKIYQGRLVKAVDFGSSYQGEIEEVYSERNALRRLCSERGIGLPAWAKTKKETTKGDKQ